MAVVTLVRSAGKPQPRSVATLCPDHSPMQPLSRSSGRLSGCHGIGLPSAAMPRHRSASSSLLTAAMAGFSLLASLYQLSALVEGPGDSDWFSLRADSLPLSNAASCEALGLLYRHRRRYRRSGDAPLPTGLLEHHRALSRALACLLFRKRIYPALTMMRPEPARVLPCEFVAGLPPARPCERPGSGFQQPG